MSDFSRDDVGMDKDGRSIEAFTRIVMVLEWGGSADFSLLTSFNLGIC